MPKNHQFNTRRKEANVSSASSSVIGKGTAGDSGQLRDSVITGVKTTLLKRMKDANDTSSKNASDLRAGIDSKVSCYNDALFHIQTLEEDSQNLQAMIAQKTAEKEALEASEDYKTHKNEWRVSKADYLSKRKASSNEEYMRKRQKDLSSQETFLAAHAAALVSLQDQMASSRRSSKKERQQTEALYRTSLNDWQEGQKKLTEERMAVQAYKQADHERLTDEYYERLLTERDTAKERYENADAAFKTERARIQALTSEIKSLSEEVMTTQKEQMQKKSDLLEASDKDEAELSAQLSRHHAESLGYSSLHDKAAMQYYILIRGKNARKTKSTEIPGHTKDIAEYVGQPAFSSLALARQFAEIKLHPESTHKHEITVTDLTAADTLVTDHIAHHKFITLTQDNKVYRLNSQYKIQTDNPAGTAAANSGSGSTAAPQGAALGEPQPVYLKDLDHSINQTDRHGNYLSAADTLAVQTVTTGSVFRGQDVDGLWLGGEFVPSNGAAYQSVSDIRKKDREKMDRFGAFDQDNELAAAISFSDFFNHIYAENIEYYARYPGDDEERNAVQLTDPDPANASLDLAALKTAYQSADEDLKAMHLFWQRDTGSNLAELIGDASLYTDTAQKDRVIAKLVHAMLVLGKDRKKAIQIADSYGSTALKDAAAGSGSHNFAALLYACEAVILNAAKTKDTASRRFFRAAGDFLGGDGPFLKGTIAEGMINYDLINDTYDNLNTIFYGFVTGKIQHIDELEAQMDSAQEKCSKIAEEYGKTSDKYKEASTEYESLETQKKNAEHDLDHKLLGDILGIINGVKDIFFGFKAFWDMWKGHRLLSDEHATEKGLNSRYVMIFDYIFDVGKSILNLLDSIVGFLGNKLFKISSISPVSDVVTIIKDIFGTLESGYKTIQSSAKVHNITKSMDTVASGRLTETKRGRTVEIDISAAAKANPQVMYFLGRARNKAGKDVADNTMDTVTGAVNVGGNFASPIGSKIIKVTTSAVSTLGRLITGGIYSGNEKTAALKAAFGDQYGRYKKNPDFDRILKMTAGINSLKHLAVVSRIFAAIDTHHMLRSASAKSRAFKLARNAMSAFYEPKAPLPGQPDNKKEGYDRIPLSAILGHVNEGDDWRSKLLAAVR